MAIRVARLRFTQIEVNHLSLVDGFCTVDQVRLLHDLVASLPDGSRIVEAGVWQGRTAIAMALACRGTNKKVYAIDPWRDYSEEGHTVDDWLKAQGLVSLERAYQLFLRNRRRFRVEPWLEVIRAPSLEAAKAWSHGPIALAFIDGNHEADAVRADIDAWMERLTPDGTLLGDDLPIGGVSEAISRYLQEHYPHVSLATPDGRTWQLMRTPKSAE
ncbi:MAG: class I SAM-dependent methyltransferase [Chloroflexota bacterium]